MAELPLNWIECELEKVVKLSSGGTPKSSNKKYYEGGTIPWLIIADLNDGYIEKAKTNITELGLRESSAKIVPLGAILIAMYGSIGKLGIANISCATNQAIAFTEKIDLNLDNKFLYYYLFSIKSYLASLGKGGAQQNISQTVLKKIPILLPPLNEQKRIVEKLDKMIRIVDDVNSRLNKIPTALKRARQSILNQAITGELTKDWREKNNIKYTWKETSLKSIVLTYKNGLSKRSGKEGKATVVLRLADLCNHKIIKDNIREIKITDNEAKQYKLDYNDILIIRVNGSEDIVGRFILYDLNENWIYCDHLIRLKYDKTIIEPYYLFYYAQTNVVREYIKANVVSSAGQNTINQKTLDNMPLLLPPIEEQAEIVRRVKLAFEKLDKIESRYQKAKEYSDKLTQSILNKAFRGELVPQDPNDKPLEII